MDMDDGNVDLDLSQKKTFNKNKLELDEFSSCNNEHEDLLSKYQEERRIVFESFIDAFFRSEKKTTNR